MPVIWSAISGHGYGHAAQVVPVLNELGRLVPGLRTILRTTVPASFFRDRLIIPWELQAVRQDVGCIQRGPLEIDVAATWERHGAFHDQWERRVTEEAAAMRAAGPKVVLADTPYLAACAAKEAGVPAIVLANFTWNEVLEPLSDPGRPGHLAILTAIRQSYACADLAMRIAPGLPLTPFSKVLDIGPIAEPAASCRSELRAHLGMAETEQLVLIGFGGIPLESLPWEPMTKMDGYRFIVDGIPVHRGSRTLSLESLPFTFKTLLASVDMVMTKPGYGTVVEAVALGVPVVYVRRYNFADEAPLVNFLQRFGRSRELRIEDFLSGSWRPALDAIGSSVRAFPPPPCTGPSEAARQLAAFF